MWFPRLATLVVTLLTATTTLAQNYPPPRACDGDCYTRDPAFLKRDDGTYFRFTTKRLIQIHTSKNINGPWEARGSVIQGRSIIDLPGNDDLWAPDISKVGDTYYLFYAVSTLGSKNSAIGYATSPSMEPGTWTDRGQVLRSTDSTPWNAIDANLYHSADGSQLHLQWGSYWNGIFTQPVTINGPTVRLVDGVAPKQVAYLPGDNNKALEGAFVYLQNGAYWLFTSRGKASEFGNDPNTFPADQAYRVFVCRGDSPTGPFFGQLGKPCTEGGGTLVYGSQGNVFAPGGQGVWHDPAYGDVLYYHYFYKNVGFGDFQSRFGWNVLKWVDGWPVAT